MTDTPKRPKDANQLAKLIADIATGEVDESEAGAEKHGKEGGKARAKKLTPEQRSAIARKAASARWADK